MNEKFILFGCGSMGSKHLSKIIENFKNAKIVVCEPHLHSMDIFHHPNVTHTNNLEKITDLFESTNNYIIASPTDYHLDILQAVIRKNVNILVEKPVGTNILLRKKILTEASRIACKVTPGFIERYSATSFLLNEIIVSQEIVEIAITRESYACPSDIDVVEDLMIHDIDLMYFCGISLGIDNIKIKNFTDSKIRDLAVEFRGFSSQGSDLKVLLKSKHSLAESEQAKRFMNIKLVDGSSLNINLATNSFECNAKFQDILNQIASNESVRSFKVSGSTIIWPDKLVLEHKESFLNNFDSFQSLSNIELFESVSSLIFDIQDAL